MKEIKVLLVILMLSVISNYGQTHFTFTSNTGSNATIVLPSNINPNINGILLSDGDEIGAFTPGGLCVGAVVWTGSNAAITVWGDNSQTPDVDGLADGETISYKIWDLDRGEEIDNITISYSSGDGVYHADAFMILSQFDGLASPASPELISPEDLSGGVSVTPDFVWNDVSADSYDIEISEDEEFNNIVYSYEGITDTTYSLVSSLKYLHSYYWRVRGINTVGTGNWSLPFSFTTGNREQSHFEFTSNTGNNATVTIPSSINPTVNGESIEIGDEIGVFTPEGLCVGAVVWAGSNTAITVWGDDSQTTEVDGIQEGEEIKYRIWKYSNEEEYSAVSEYSTGDGIYHSDAFYVLSAFAGISLPETVDLESPADNAIGLIQPIELKWKTSNYSDNYTLQVSTDENFTTMLVDTSGLTDTTFTLSALSNLTQYYWRVKGVNVGGESDWSDTWNFKTLGEPTTVEAIYPAEEDVNIPINLTFVWSKAEDQLKPVVIGGGIKGKGKGKEEGINGTKTIGAYWFELTKDVNGTAEIVDTTLTDTTKTVNGLDNLTDYWWRVKAQNETGWGEFTAWSKFTTIVDTPAVVSLALPANNSAGNILPVNLVWNVSDLAESYKLEVSTDENFTTMIVDTAGLTDTTFTLSSLSNLTRYYWRVKGVNIGGESNWSEAWNFKTLGEPTTVETLYPAEEDVNIPIELTFVWTKAEDQLKPVVIGGGIKGKGKGKEEGINGTKTIGAYWFELTKDVNGTAEIVDTTLTDTTKTVNGLDNLTDYWWRVKAQNETGWGEFTAWSKFTTIVDTPAVVSLALPANNSAGNILPVNLVWNVSDLAESYKLEVSTDENFTTMIVDTAGLTDTTFTLSSLSNLTRYYWRVKGVNVGGESDWSETWNFKTLGEPTTVDAVYPEDNAVNIPLELTFVWTKAEDQTKPVNAYWFELTSDTSSVEFVVRDTAVVDTFYSVSGLEHLTDYYWRVKSSNEAGWSEFSNWFKFTTIVQVPEMVELITPVDSLLYDTTMAEIEFSWTSSEFTDFYEIEISNNEDFSELFYSADSLTDTTIVFNDTTSLGGGEFNGGFYWRVRAKNIAGASAWADNYVRIIIVGVEEENGELPANYALKQNYPNPFNPTTVIKYSLPEMSSVKVSVYDILGKELEKLVNKEQSAGNYRLEFDASKLTSGIYLYRIEAVSKTSGNRFVQTKKMLLLK